MATTSYGLTTGQAFPMPDPECYIYLHHTKTCIILPSFAQANNDSITVKFNSSIPLMRTAPIYSYANSGPRTLQVQFNLHRDMMNEINYKNAVTSSVTKEAIATIEASKDDTGFIDYVDILAKQIQGAALPVYSTSDKMVNPPLVSLKLGNDIFIKGVVSSNVGVSYGYPILSNGKYAKVDIQFGINEVLPYDATTAMTYGSYRGVSSDLDRGSIYTLGSTV